MGALVEYEIKRNPHIRYLDSDPNNGHLKKSLIRFLDLTRQVDSSKKDYAAIVIRYSTGERWFSRFWNLL